MSDPEATDPGIQQKLAEANKRADPLADRAMAWVTDSPYTAPIVVAVVLLLVAAGKWLL